MKKISNIFILGLFVILGLLLISCDTNGEKINSITVTGETVLEVGDDATYEATINPSSMQDELITWSVVKETGDAEINQSGKLTALEEGTVKVKASAKGVDGVLTVTITGALSGVNVAGPDNVYLETDAEYTFTVSPENALYDEVAWAVLAGTGSATIDQNGKLTPVTAGEVTVRATVDGIVGVKTVTIKTPVKTLTITGNAEIRMGENYDYEFTFTPANADLTDIAWTVIEDTGEATITNLGVLTPINVGLVTIKLEVDGVSKELVVEIIKSVESITITGDDVILPEERPEYSAEVLPLDAKYKDVTWSIEPLTGDATISELGVLTPVSSGTVKVIATADGVSESFEVEIEEDDRLLGTPRPTHLLATPENTVVISGEWVVEGNVPGLDVNFARQVYDVSFDVAASRSDAKVLFAIPNNVDLSRMQYFALKVTGHTETEGVNPTVSINLRDDASGLSLYNDQQTEIEVTSANQWIIFQVSNRYRLQTDNRNLVIAMDPHFTASGNNGVLTIQQVVFFGNQDPVTSPELLTPLKTAHWESNPQFTAEPATDVLDGKTIDVIKASATADAVSGWLSLPSYVLEDISRTTTISFKVKLLTEGLPSNPKLAVYLGEQEVSNVTVNRPTGDNDPVYQEVTLTIPPNFRTEANMWNVRYLQLKPNGGGNVAVEYYIYDFKLLGDANPTPVPVTREQLGGANVRLDGTVNYVENGTGVKVAAGDEPAHVLFTPNEGAGLSKLEFGYNKSAGNAAQRAGLNGVYVKIQGTAGLSVNLQQGWSDDWADAADREFVLDGTVQEVYIIALSRSTITGGTGWFAFEFSVTTPSGIEDPAVKIFEFSMTAILPEVEDIKEERIDFDNFVEATDILVEDEDTMTVSKDNYGNVVANVEIDHENNHIVGLAINKNIRYMTRLTIKIKGDVGAKATFNLAYGNMFNMDDDYVHTFNGEVETIVIDILDRDALKVSKISLSIFFDLDALDEAEFTLYEAFFEGVK